jgi:DNA-binding NarL/FixJ family response regulator
MTTEPATAGAAAKDPAMRIGIAEDSGILRQGLTELLTARRYRVTISVATADELLHEAGAAGTAPAVDLVVADIRMPPTHTDEGVRAAIELRQRFPGLPVVLFSQYVETEHVSRLLGADATGVGYLLKDRVSDVTQFIDTLHRVARGETVLDPIIVARLLAASRHRDALAQLTGRERQILTLMAEGRSNTAIAATTHLSLGGLEKNISTIFAKLGLEPSPDTHRRILAVLTWLGLTRS